MGSAGRSDKFLPSLTRAFQSLDTQAQINTQAFVEAVEAILPVFDDLGECPKFRTVGASSCCAQENTLKLPGTAFAAKHCLGSLPWLHHRLTEALEYLGPLALNRLQACATCAV
jgi:hypothetical protein